MEWKLTRTRREYFLVKENNANATNAPVAKKTDTNRKKKIYIYILQWECTQLKAGLQAQLKIESKTEQNHIAQYARYKDISDNEDGLEIMPNRECLVKFCICLMLGQDSEFWPK